jgi:hypothetical protein
MGRRPRVRGLAMNACDHPHGGGRGKSKGNKHPRSVYGWLTRGKRTRRPKDKDGNKMYVLEVRVRHALHRIRQQANTTFLFCDSIVPAAHSQGGDRTTKRTSVEILVMYIIHIVYPTKSTFKCGDPNLLSLLLLMRTSHHRSTYGIDRLSYAA